MGWKPTSDVTLVGGMQPQPFYTTSMVWSDDINPTGASEKWDHTFDNGLETFVTAGQYVYAAANGNGISNALGASDASTTFMFAEQAWIKFNFDKDTYFKAAASFYTYNGSYNFTPPAASAANPSQVAALYSTAPSALAALTTVRVSSTARLWEPHPHLDRISLG